MKITVSFFGYTQEWVRVPQIELEIRGARVTLGVVLKELQRRYPQLEGRLSNPLRFALNTQYAGLDALIKEGDTVSLLPPVGGG
jgi:molybdopterin converting factor small subunit